MKQGAASGEQMLTGRQYDKIKLIYEERRRNRDRLKLKRQTEVFGKLPGYRELDTAIRNLSINTALKSFDIEDEEERRQQVEGQLTIEDWMEGMDGTDY